MKFLKNFGLGLLTIFLLPFFLVLLAIAAVYLFFVYLVELFRNTIRFFKGEKGFRQLPEDLQVAAIKEKKFQQSLPQEAPKNEAAPTPPPTNVYIQQNYYQKDPNQNLQDFIKEANASSQTPYLSQSPSNFPNNPAIPNHFVEDSQPNLNQIPYSPDPEKVYDENEAPHNNEPNDLGGNL